MSFMSLPDLVRVKIFLLLPGESLHRCRQVCHRWNNFIVEKIWKSNFARKQLEEELERNWGAGSGDLKYDVSLEVYEPGLKHSDIMAATGDYLVIKKFYPKDFPNVAVANVITKDLWQVTMEPKFSRDEVLINDSLLAIWSSSDLEDDAGSYSATVKVWSVESKEKLLERVVPKFYNLVFEFDKSSSLPMIVLILEEKIEILSFDDTSISKCEFAFDVDVGYRWSFSNFVFPYILHCFDQRQDDFKISIFVWKIDTKTNQIENHKSLPCIKNFHMTDENEVVMLVSDAVYVSSCFVVAGYDERNCVVTILNDDGDFFREVEINIKKYDFCGGAYFFIHGRRLFVKLDGATCAIFKLDLKELLSVDSTRNVLYRKLVALKQNTTRHHVFVTDKTSIASVTNKGISKFKIKKMNFWPT